MYKEIFKVFLLKEDSIKLYVKPEETHTNM